MSTTLVTGLIVAAVAVFCLYLLFKATGFLLRLGLVAFVLAAAWWYLAPALGLPPIPL